MPAIEPLANIPVGYPAPFVAITAATSRLLPLYLADWRVPLDTRRYELWGDVSEEATVTATMDQKHKTALQGTMLTFIPTNSSVKSS